MAESALRIFARNLDHPPLDGRGRLVALLIALACGTVLGVATWLNPNPAGMGTHRQLGLSECAFLQRTGLPCPSCGMTTSFAYLMHGHPGMSFYTQPFGMVLAVLTLIVFWASLYIALSANPVHRLAGSVASQLLIPMLLFGIVAWGWKIFIVVTQRP